MSKRLGDRVKERMLLRGLNQTELAKLAGVSEGFVTNLLNNPEKDFQVKKLQLVAKALKCSVSDLID